MRIKNYRPTSRLITHTVHNLLQPWQSSIRKHRLRDFDLSPAAVLPVVTLNPMRECRCTAPHCEHLISDALRFHRSNAPRRGILRWTTPSAMLLDLNKFQTGDSYIQAVSKRSKGNIPRAAKKAARLGITCMPIRPEGYSASIATIQRSKRFRSGGPVLAAWFADKRILEDSPVPFEMPACPSHWTLCWGAFMQEKDGPRLIAYLSLRRVGDLCRTHELMAHGDYLHTNVMKLLFLEVARWLTDKTAMQTQGLSWFMYGALEHGGPGLHEWKRLFCFEPKNFILT